MSNNITVIIDGNSVAYRAFFGAPPLKAGDTPTGVIHLFLTVLDKLSALPNVSKVITVFDAKGKNHRHELLESYKETRQAMPEDLAVQMDIIKELIPLMGLPLLSISGYEADDVINTLAKDIEGEIYIITKDKDLHQLIDDRIKIYDYQKNIIIGRNEVHEKFGLYPENIKDMLALAGDASDNIPGVKGVGLITATKLLNDYKSLDNVYANIENIKGKLKENLVAGKELAYLSLKLVELKYIDNLQVTDNVGDENKLLNELTKYQLTKQIDKIKDGAARSATISKKKLKPLDEGDVSDPKILIFFEGDTYLADDNNYTLVSSKIDNIDYVYDIKSLLKTGFYSYHNDVIDIMLASYLIDTDSGGLSVNKKEDIATFFARIVSQIDTTLDRLKSEKLDRLYYDTELPVAYVLSKAEVAGVLIDKKRIESNAQSLKVRISKVSKRILDIAQYDLNLNSPKQLSDFLYNRLGLQQLTKTNTSTDEQTLIDLRLANPSISVIIDDILQYRGLSKLSSTYTTSMLDYIASDGRIHTSFKQTGTATGRLSSIKPNLQNIPRSGEEAAEIRSAFVSQQGYTLVSFDYSQIELRILADRSGDKNLIDAYNNDLDIHNITAKKIFNLESDDEITDDFRRTAKAVNFGIIYGLSAFGLSRDISMPQGDAKVFIDRYYSSYPSVKTFLDGVIEETKHLGYSKTILGRKRYIADINSRNNNIKQRATRMALNAPIQGSAADIIKLAMIAADKYIVENSVDAKLLLQIHDELLFEVNDTIVDKFSTDIKVIMQAVIKLKVPLIVNYVAGKDWGKI